MQSVGRVVVLEEEGGMRLDRWFKAHYPSVSFVVLQKLLRSGQIRIGSKRAKSDIRLECGQVIRIPPAVTSEKRLVSSYVPLSVEKKEHSEALFKMLIYEDEHVFIFNKRPGLSVQGGSGISLHMDAMLESWRNKKGERPRLVHRLDRETSGVFVVARTRLSAMKLAESFRTRKAKKIYWSLVKGVPSKIEGKISTWLVKERTAQGDRVRLAQHGEKGAEHAVSFYRIFERAASSVSWLQMEPYTGRTHQLRVHAAHIGTPILGDSKYFLKDSSYELPGGIQNKLHLHAWRIVIPHPKEGLIDLKAPIPAHMQQSWNVFGFDTRRGDNEEI